MALLSVKAECDRDAGVWYVSDSDVPGLATEAPTFDELCQKVSALGPLLLMMNSGDNAQCLIA